jgi:hypothetical protein
MSLESVGTGRLRRLYSSRLRTPTVCRPEVHSGFITVTPFHGNKCFRIFGEQQYYLATPFAEEQLLETQEPCLWGATENEQPSFFLKKTRVCNGKEKGQAGPSLWSTRIPLVLGLPTKFR